MVCWRRWKRQWNILFRLEFSGGQVSCPRLWGCPRNLTSGDFPFWKVSATLASMMSFSASMYNVLHQRTLGRSVNHHWTRVLLSADQILQFPHNPWAVDFSTVVQTGPKNQFHWLHALLSGAKLSLVDTSMFFLSSDTTEIQVKRTCPKVFLHRINGFRYGTYNLMEVSSVAMLFPTTLHCIHFLMIF